MIKSTKVILAALVVVALLIGSFGCSGSAPAPTAAPAAATAAPATSAPAAAATSAPAAAATKAPAAAPTTAAAAKPATGKPIKVGEVAALTGVLGELGNANINGTKLAVEDVNKNGGINGRPIELVVYDDQGDPASSVTRAEKLITQDQVEAMIVGTHASTATAARAVNEKYSIVGMSPQAQNREVTQGVKWLFRVGTIDVNNAVALIDLMVARGYSKPSLQTSTSAFGTSGLRALQTALDQKGIKAVDSQTHKEGSSDLTAQILNAKNAGADCLLLWAQGMDAALMAKTAKQLSFNVPIMGVDSLTHASAIPAAGPAYEGVVAVSIVDTSRPDVAAFFDRYKTVYGVLPPVLPSPCQGYDALTLLADGLKKVVKDDGKIDQNALKAALETTKGAQGYTGAAGIGWTFTPDNHDGLPKGSETFYVVKNGKWEKLSSYKDLLDKPDMYKNTELYKK